MIFAVLLILLGLLIFDAAIIAESEKFTTQFSFVLVVILAVMLHMVAGFALFKLLQNL